MESSVGKGYIHIYTGNGKGKTTAALGLAFRAAGAGLKVLFVQFMKDFAYSELESLQRFEDLITVKRFGNDQFVLNRQPPSDEDKAIAKNGIAYAIDAMKSGEYDVVILDEICVTTYFKLLKEEDLIPLFANKPEGIELVLTGRYCPDSWIEQADLATDMREVKHYYEQRILSRKGIDS